MRVIPVPSAPVLKVVWDREFMGRQIVGRHTPMGLEPTDEPDAELTSDELEHLAGLPYT